MLKARLATEVGTAADLRIYVSSVTDQCSGKPTGNRSIPLSYHNASVRIATVTEIRKWGFAGSPEDYQSEFSDDPRWPATCDGCGKTWEEIEARAEGIEVSRQVFCSKLWDTPNGDLEPGCIFWSDWEHWDEDIKSSERDGKKIVWGTPTPCRAGWSNCDGRHLRAIVPGGHDWNMDGRASNCGSPEDQEHRCWVREGEPPMVTVGKGGNTCKAGAGSIATPNWHGFLRGGNFVG